LYIREVFCQQVVTALANFCQRGGKVLPMGRQSLVIGVARKAEKGAFDEFL